MSAARVVVRAAAKRDMVKHYAWLSREADADTAERFMAAADSAFAKLADVPGMGSPVPSHDNALAAMRKWRVDGFPNMLIFYQPDRKGVRILRVFHAASDWWSQSDVN